MTSIDPPPVPLPLHDHVKAVVWRIFGNLASPMWDESRSIYELVERIVSKRCKSISPQQKRSNIDEIEQWIHSSGKHHWLRPDKMEIVADLILSGIEDDRSETKDWAIEWHRCKTKVWAIGSIDPALAARLTRTRWPSEKIEKLIDATIRALGELRKKGMVLDTTRLARFDHTKVEITEKSLRREGRLETFRNLDNTERHIVLNGLPPTVANLVDLLVSLWTKELGALIDKLGHPVMQARAAHVRIQALRSSDHRETLNWIVDDSCDPAVAVAIVHTLNTVNELDYDLRFADRRSLNEHGWATELRPPEDNLGVAAGRLLTDLVERLIRSNSPESARWIGELLSGAPSILHRDWRPMLSSRIGQLEDACIEALVSLVIQSWSDSLIPKLCCGLRLTPIESWTRHVAETAWRARSLAPAQATEIARSTLAEHERQLTSHSEYGIQNFDLSRSDDKTWIQGLGTALALSEEDLDLPQWISAQCRALPLAVWDAEEDIRAFLAADRVAIHWFLVAFSAIPRLNELGHPADPSIVRSLAETFWRHKHFVQRYSHGSSGGPTAEEFVSRSVIEFGEPSDTWLLAMAGAKRVGPMSLFALIDQRQIKTSREGGTDVRNDDMFRTKFTRIAADRFGEAERFGLEQLHSWGLLWLALQAADQACRTASAIIAFRLERRDKRYKIAALKLFAFAASRKRLDRASSNQMRVLYNELWSRYTHTIGKERRERNEIDKLLDMAVEHRP